MIKIEKNIAIPKSRNSRKHKYPFEEMEVWDSFFVNLNDLDIKVLQNKLNCAVNNFLRREKVQWKFITRREDNGVRVWRVL